MKGGWLRTQTEAKALNGFLSTAGWSLKSTAGAWGLFLCLVLLTACGATESPDRDVGSATAERKSDDNSEEESSANPSDDQGAAAPDIPCDMTVAVKDGQFTMIAKDDLFIPDCLKVEGKLSLTIRNDGRAKHNFSVATLDLSKDVAPHKSVTVRLKVKNDPIAFVCNIHPRTMYGALIPPA